MADSPQVLESESTQLLDIRLMKHQLAYAFASVRRHLRLFLGLFVGIFAVTASSLFLLPKTYHVETELLTQRNAALAIRGDQAGEIPTRIAVETIMRRDNLVAIIRQVDLIHQWYNRRAPLAHVKDVIMRALTKAETEQQTIEWMADVLEKKMTVTTTEGTVTIGLDWPDPTMAVRLVDAAQQNYLEARHAIEISAIAEQVAILQNHAATSRSDVDAAVDAIEKMREDRKAKTSTAVAAAAAEPHPSSPTATAPSPSKPVSLEPDPELSQLKVMIEAKQRAINDLEEFRQRRLSELNATLAEKRATYTDNHPVIIDLRQTIDSLSTESPQVKSLRAEVDRLQQDFDTKAAAARAESRPVPLISGKPAGTPPPLPGNIIRIEQEGGDDRDPAMMYAFTQLRDAMQKYSTLRAQIEAAQIDFDTAEAAFKYRYSVVNPPIFPKKPSKPNATLVSVAGLLGGLFVALFAAIAVDLRRGRFYQLWQIERALDLPTLTELDPADLVKHQIGP